MALVTVLLFGCAQKHPVSIGSGIQPAPVTTPKAQARVAVSFREPMRSYRHHVDAVQLRTKFHSYDFEIGPALCKALLQSVTAAYTTAAEVSKLPARGDYAVVIVFTLRKSQIDVSFEDRLTPSARALSVFGITVELFDGTTMAPLRSAPLNARAFLIRALREVSSRDGEKVFAAAIEESIQQLADNTVALLVQWAEEPLQQ